MGTKEMRGIFGKLRGVIAGLEELRDTGSTEKLNEFNEAMKKPEPKVHGGKTKMWTICDDILIDSPEVKMSSQIVHIFVLPP